MRKALGLLKKGNATLIEWLDSPVVYHADAHFLSAMRDAAQQTHQAERSFHHYVHMARKNYREYLRGDTVRLKKYLYVLRPLLATLDGDLQNDPADLPRLLKELESCDFACGWRQNRQDTFVRRLSSRLARAARSAALGAEFRDTGCALRVFRRTALAGVFGFNGLHRFLPILVAGGGFRVREVPVSHRPRVAGVSKYGVWNRLGRGLHDLMAIAWYQRRRVQPVQVEHTPAPRS